MKDILFFLLRCAVAVPALYAKPASEAQAKRHFRAGKRVSALSYLNRFAYVGLPNGEGWV